MTAARSQFGFYRALMVCVTIAIIGGARFQLIEIGSFCSKDSTPPALPHAHVSYSHRHTHSSSAPQNAEHEHTHVIHLQSTQIFMLTPDHLPIFRLAKSPSSESPPSKKLAKPDSIFLASVFRPPIST